jgi:hypothetical protein
MTELSNKQKRPSSLTFICIGILIGAIFAGQSAFSPISRQIASWYPTYLGFSAVGGLVCTIGLWSMRKWAVYAFIGLILVNLIVLFIFGNFNVVALMIGIIVIYVVSRHLPKMT